MSDARDSRGLQSLPQMPSLPPLPSLPALPPLPAFPPLPPLPSDSRVRPYGGRQSAPQKYEMSIGFTLPAASAGMRVSASRARDLAPYAFGGAAAFAVLGLILAASD